MQAGNFILALHAHLPYVLHHGSWPHGSDWLCEAVAESYIPLLNALNELRDEGCASKLSIDISPVLSEQLEHPDFVALFGDYCDNRIEAARKDRAEFSASPELSALVPIADFWFSWYSERKNDFTERYGGSIANAFSALQQQGAIEIFTCGATHGYYALLGSDKSIRAQMRAANANYQQRFGVAPRGAWAPECSYRPSYEWHSYLPASKYETPRLRAGVEQLFAQNSIEYFFIDQAPLERFEPLGILADDNEPELIPVTSEQFQPTPWNFDRSPLNLYQVSSDGDVRKGTAIVFARHRDVSMQVWSGDSGYPGDPCYLDFHKKYNKSNLRYWRVTDNKADMQYKQPYVPEWTVNQAELHAHHFIKTVEGTLLDYQARSGRFGGLCVSFDAELFGHWWFEGPMFIKAVLRGLHHSPYVNAVTASEHVDRMNPREVVALPESSWGDGGGHDVWMNDDTKWMWSSIYNAEIRYDEMLQPLDLESISAVLRRILTQALRELMLLQASDWEFLVTTMTAKDYAEQRFLNHHSDFTRLCDMADVLIAEPDATMPDGDMTFLEETERRNAIFPELRLEWWAYDDIDSFS